MSAFELKETKNTNRNESILYLSIFLWNKLHLDVHQLSVGLMVLPLDHEDFRNKDQLQQQQKHSFPKENYSLNIYTKLLVHLVGYDDRMIEDGQVVQFLVVKHLIPELWNLDRIYNRIISCNLV